MNGDGRMSEMLGKREGGGAMSNEDGMPGLPSFKNPPVIEVLMAIQFSEIAGFRGVHPGRFWDQISAQYPQVSEHPPVDPTFETFGTEGESPASLEPFAMFSSNGLPNVRTWYESGDSEWVIQIQSDRLICNWRGQPTSMNYPRYPVLKDRFLKAVTSFAAYVEGAQLGPMQVNQAEMVYVNLIHPGDFDPPVDHLSDVLSLVSESRDVSPRIRAEAVAVRAQFVGDVGEDRLARIYVDATPVRRHVDGRQALRVQITARGRPADRSLIAAAEMLDREREMVVQTFKFVTTPKMHSQWGIENG